MHLTVNPSLDAVAVIGDLVGPALALRRAPVPILTGIAEASGDLTVLADSVVAVTISGAAQQVVDLCGLLHR